ncbi:hypothetical protein OJ996_21285 [Luteolibacter sp. GHJ8]|uniref:DUF11 domain-containing protein n=1 Tax=Luteolibacter rhizosphaerae TaxID=2989719 RepID=A0ABT3G8G0_9BACT|nr:hypothetical protein [Luteolibacter rhizosphaerae]MCW1916137.1 hypothetical protein [Luteolibacter rhizosphaerae]
MNRWKSAGCWLGAWSLLGIAQVSADVLHTSNFDTGFLPKDWKVSRTVQGQAILSADFEPIQGTRQLVLHDAKNDAKHSVTEATLRLPLLDHRDVVLSFKAKSIGDGNLGRPVPEGIYTKSGRDFDAVSVSVDGKRWVVVQSFVGLPNGPQDFTLSLDAAAASLGGYGKVPFMIRFSWFGRMSAPWAGLAIDDVKVTGIFDPRVELQIPAVVTEGAAPLKVRATRGVVTKETMTLQLSGDPSGVLDFPASVTFPKKAKFVEFTVSAPNDGVLNPHRQTTVRAGWAGREVAAAPVRVGDVTPLAVSLELPAELREGGPAGEGRVVFNRHTDAVVPVQLAADPAGQLEFPATIEVPAGTIEMTFPLSASNDTLFDGDVEVGLNATFAGGSASTSTTAVDNDEMSLRVELPATVREGGSVTGTLFMGASHPHLRTRVNLEVSGHSLYGPGPIELLPGETTATFTLNSGDDVFAESDRSHVVTARATGYQNGSTTIRVLENDLSKLRFDPLAGAVEQGTPFPVTLRAADGSGLVLEGVEGAANLVAVNADGSTHAVSPATVTLSQGSWTGQVTLPEAALAPVALRATRGTASTEIALSVARTLAMKASDLAVDPTRGKIYAAFSWDGGEHANKVLAIDPKTGAVTATVNIGANCGKLAITSGGEFLYVAHTSDGMVSQIDLATFTVVRSFGAQALDMATVPGNPNRLISLTLSGVWALENGVLLPQKIQHNNIGNFLEASSDPGVFFCFNGLSTEYGFRKIFLGPDGVTEGPVMEGIFHEEVGEVVAAGDFVFDNHGRMANGLAMKREINFPAFGPVCPDLQRKRVYFLAWEAAGYRTLKAFDPATAHEIAQVNLPASHTNPKGLVRWGESGLAFRSEKGITLFQIPRLTGAGNPADLEVRIESSTGAAATGDPVEYEVVVSNEGTAQAPDTLVTVDLGGDQTIERVDSPAIPYTQSGKRISFHPGVLPQGGSRSFKIKARAGGAGLIAASAAASSSVVDPDFEPAVAAVSVEFDNAPGAFNELRLAINDIVEDPTRGLLWLALGAEAGAGLANSIVSLDPTTGHISQPIPLWATPGMLKVSENGTYLHAVLLDLPLMQRVRLDLHRKDLRHVFGGTADGQRMFGGDFEILDGDGRSIVISRYDPLLRPGIKGVAVYDDGVVRPRIEHSFNSSVLEDSPDASIFYGYDNASTGFGFSHLKVDAEGVRTVASRSYMFSYNFAIRLESAGDKVFATDGGVVDGLAMKGLGNFGTNGPMVPDPQRDRAFFLESSGDAGWNYDVLTSYSTDTMMSEFSRRLPKGYGLPRRMIRWGNNGIAFSVDQTVVLLSDPHLIPSGDPADLGVQVSVTSGEAMVGEPIRYRVDILNEGPNPATECFASVFVTEGQVVESVDGAPFVRDGNWYSFYLGDLAPDEDVRIEIVTRMNQPGTAQCFAYLEATSDDPRAGNNSDTAVVPVSYNRGLDAVNRLQLALSGMVKDPVQDLIWCSVSPGGPPGLARSVVAIDPANGTIKHRIPMSNAPGTLAISADGRWLYAGLLDMTAIRRIDLQTRTLDILIELGPDRFAGEIEVLQGDGRSVVVAMQNRTLASRFAALAVYDDAVKRLQEITSWEGSVNEIASSADPGIFFGINTDSTGADFYRLRVSATGVVVEEGQMRAIREFWGGLRSDGDYVVMDTGRRIDGATITWKGEFNASGTALPETGIGRVFFVEHEFDWGSRADSARRISAYDSNSMVKVLETPLPEGLGWARDFLRCGGDRMAFRSNGELILVRSSQLTPSAVPSDLAVSVQAPPVVHVGVPAFYTVTITNVGQSAVTSTVTGVNLSVNQTLGTIDAPGATHTVEGLRVTIKGGPLAAGASAVYRVAGNPETAGVLSCNAGVTSPAVEVQLANNKAEAINHARYTMGPNAGWITRFTAKDIIDDPTRNWIWASVASSGKPGAQGAVSAIDPLTGLVMARVSFTGNPTALAISRNGRYLYAALLDQPAVQRIDLVSRTADLLIPLGDDPAYRAEDMLVLEGDGTALMVARNDPPTTWTQAGVAVYDGAVKRPNVTPRPWTGNRIEASPDPNVFYGFNGRNTGAELYRMTVDANGVTQTMVANTLFAPFTDYRASGNLLFTSSGRLIDTTSLSVKFSLPNGNWGIPWVDAAHQSCYLTNNIFLYAYSTETGEEKETFPIGGLNYPGAHKQMVRWGTDGFAILGENGKILFLRWALAPYTPPVAAGEADATVAGTTLDSDGDGLADALEYFFGTSATAPQAGSPVKVLGVNEGGLHLTFTRRQGLPAGAYRIAVSGDMKSWQAAEGVVESVTGTAEIDGVMVETVEARVPCPVGRGFVRIEWDG